LAWAFEQQSQFSEAVRAYRGAIRVKPDDYPAWKGLGHDYLELSEWAEAIASLHEAVRLEPKKRAAWYDLCIAYGRQGDQARAIDAQEHFRTLSLG